MPGLIIIPIVFRGTKVVAAARDKRRRTREFSTVLEIPKVSGVGLRVYCVRDVDNPHTASLYVRPPQKLSFYATEPGLGTFWIPRPPALSLFMGPFLVYGRKGPNPLWNHLSFFLRGKKDLQTEEGKGISGRIGPLRADISHAFISLEPVLSVLRACKECSSD